MNENHAQPDDSAAPLDEKKYASRSGLKLEAALECFSFEVTGLCCADFGCNVGGFTDCLLTRGAARVYAVDTGYGALAWKLRRDERVVVMERTNALHATAPEPVDLVVIDVAWTPQKLILPAARSWLRPGGAVISLVKPHYEATAAQPSRGRRGGRGAKAGHVLDRPAALETLEATLAEIAADRWRVAGRRQSPLIGSHGNLEFLVLLKNEGAV